jgi:murein DD-endopeptidase MepM/ murein hydrolase activator NlpD
VVGTSTAKAPPDTDLGAETFAYPADGSIVSVGSATAGASAEAEAIATATAQAELTDVSLFGGEVTIAHLLARASARATAEDASGDTLSTTVDGLVFQGQPVSLFPNGRVTLGDWGYMQTLVQTVGGGDPGTKGYHQSLRVLDIHLTADHGGLAAGSEIIIGWAEAFAQATPEAETVTIPPSGPPPSGPTKPEKKGAKRPKGSKQGKGHPVKPIPSGLEPRLSPKGYVFPVYGTPSFGPSFGSPRADTGWHHGIDIFAPTGTPVLAVAQGTVFSVGWNNLGGNRLWLRDRKGNEFYYAHLSAFSPLAVNRMQVRAGAVLGFVGNSGDAITTPPHLHFEVHPAALLGLGYDRSAIDPYDWLVGLVHLRDIEFPAGTGDWARQIAKHASAQKPGAVLLHSADISALSHLDARSLKRLLGPSSSDKAPLIDRA